jgi:hypothetical protein
VPEDVEFATKPALGKAMIVSALEHELSGSEFTRYELTSPYAATQGARLRRPASAARTP